MTKKLIVTQVAKAALQGSIQKWVNVVNTGKSGAGSDDCPLCCYYNNIDEDVICGQCPIYLDTATQFCAGTPYTAYTKRIRDAWREVNLSNFGKDPTLVNHAKDMLRYLSDLDARCTVDPTATENGVAWK